jgi:hypothetical protein
MSLTDITCCHGGPHTVECNYCSHSPRYVTRQDIEIEHTRQTLVASVAVEQALAASGYADSVTSPRRSVGIQEVSAPPAPAEQQLVAFEKTAKSILAEGANTALTMVEVGIAAGLSTVDAIAQARLALCVWGEAA